MPTEELRIPVDHAGVEWVSARLDRPQEDGDGQGAGRSALLLAHGAGAGMDSPLLENLAQGLAERGLTVLRFNYAYVERALREGSRRPPPPDRRPVLESVHRTALAFLRQRVGQGPILLGGKSMGGRMASYLAAEGADCAALVLVGYPLHPPGRPEKLRSEHFGAIAQPALFLQGTRDALCRLDLLRPALETFGGKVTLHTIEDGDHDFAVPARSGRTRQEVLAELVATVDAWEAATLP